jgi:hypothetical protein
MKTPRTLLVTGGALFLLACEGSITSMCGCPPVAYVARVYGTVSAPGGASAAGARVSVAAAPGACGALPYSMLDSGPVLASGRYAFFVSTGILPAAGDCVVAYALPPAGSTLRGSDTVAVTLTFDLADSTRVDLSLRAP